jgi:peptidase E
MANFMNTKFILHGGFNPEKIKEDNSDFYTEILKGTPQITKLLLVPFAKDADRVALSIKKVSSEFIKNNSWNKHIEIKVASEHEFIEQLLWADVIYFHGGVSLRLLETLKKFSSLEKCLAHKTVAGESAGANVWARYFYSPQADTVVEGLDVLPIKIIPHFKEEYKGKLDIVGQQLEEVYLPEYTFRVFQK